MAMLFETPKVGDEVKIIMSDECPGVNGRTGVVTEVDITGYFDVDIPSTEYGNYTYVDPYTDVYEIIKEAGESDVHALLANIARRLSEVEAAQEQASFEAIVDGFEEAVADLSDEGNDAVDSPSHYKLGKFETIEVIEEITKGYDDGFVAHCAGTAIKYIARAPHKHDTPLEDLRKAARYLDFAIERLQAGDAE